MLVCAEARTCHISITNGTRYRYVKLFAEMNDQVHPVSKHEKINQY